MPILFTVSSHSPQPQTTTDGRITAAPVTTDIRASWPVVLLVPFLVAATGPTVTFFLPRLWALLRS